MIVPLLIESVFLAKLVNSELYGDPPEGLLDALKLRVTEATDEGLNAAAEKIIRTHRNGSFPKYPQCVEAIEATAIRMPKPGAVGKGRELVVTPHNYAQLCKEHGERMGYGKGGYPVLDKVNDEPEWNAWMTYYGRIGFRGALFMMGQETTKRWTVPARWPDEFDASFRGQARAA